MFQKVPRHVQSDVCRRFVYTFSDLAHGLGQCWGVAGLELFKEVRLVESELTSDSIGIPLKEDGQLPVAGHVRARTGEKKLRESF